MNNPYDGEFPNFYEFKNVTYHINWNDIKSIDLFINHLDQTISEKKLEEEMEQWDVADNIVDLSDDYTEAKDMLRSIGVKV